MLRVGSGREPGHLLGQEGGEGVDGGLDGLGPGYETVGLLLERDGVNARLL